MAEAAKVYIMRDANSGTRRNHMAGTFPGTLRGLTEALDDARYRSAAGPPKVVIVGTGKQRSRW